MNSELHKHYSERLYFHFGQQEQLTPKIWHRLYTRSSCNDELKIAKHAHNEWKKQNLKKSEQNHKIRGWREGERKEESESKSERKQKNCK